jgi:hypothetical protein
VERNVLLVEAPGGFRDELAAALGAAGGKVTAVDDAIDALGCIDAVAPAIVVVSSKVGAPGCDAVCRIVRRRAAAASVFVLVAAADEHAPAGATLLVRGDGAPALAAIMLPPSAPSAAAAPAAPSAPPPSSGHAKRGTASDSARPPPSSSRKVDAPASTRPGPNPEPPSRRGSARPPASRQTSGGLPKVEPLPREEPVTDEPPRASTKSPPKSEPLARIQLVKRAETTSKAFPALTLDPLDLPDAPEPRARPEDAGRAAAGAGASDIAALLDEEIIRNSGMPSAPSSPGLDAGAPLSALLAAAAAPSSPGAAPSSPGAAGAPSAPPAAASSRPAAVSFAVPKAPSSVDTDLDLPGLAPPARAPSASPSRPSDPRFLSLEPLLAHGEWDRICELLGPPEKVAELPPSLGLVYAIARKEAAGEASAGDADAIAIRSVAALLGVGASSEAALVVAKRALRRNPNTWRTRPAPKKGLSVALVVIALVLGVLAGAMGPLSWRFF